MVLICSIRAEEAASDALRNLLRTVKGDSKTLGNKSSSLSFKNKIDLLYDIEDLNKDEYSSCLRFMEIRNQFIHNPSCNSFKDLENEAPDLSGFLKTKLPSSQTDGEENYQESFTQLWIRVMGKILTLKLEYRKGSTDEMLRYVNAKTMNNFDDIFKSACAKWKESKAKKHQLRFIN